MPITKILPLFFILTAFTFTACDDAAPEQSSNEDYQRTLLSQLLQAKPGDIIEIPEGTFTFNRSLTLNTDNVTIRGQGMDKSILSFKEQIQGAEGLFVSANNFTIENLAIEDAKGDALKISKGENIVIRNVRTEWTNGPDEKNGAYGIYPVQTVNTLIEGSIAIGASDAGIYVGQSRNVIVRNNRAEFNVAGIEVENTQGADVYNNVSTNNTGGILVFNMPNLPQPGGRVRVYDNDIFENNTKNFAPKGSAVSYTPAGSGMLINAHDHVEIFNNRIKDNETANIIISSAQSVGYYDKESASDGFDPYPESISIYDNEFEGGGNKPDHLELKALRVLAFGITGSLPDILWDGFYNADALIDGSIPQEKRICVDNGEAMLVNVDGPNGFKNVSTDMSLHRCKLDKLPTISLN